MLLPGTTARPGALPPPSPLLLPLPRLLLGTLLLDLLRPLLLRLRLALGRGCGPLFPASLLPVLRLVGLTIFFLSPIAAFLLSLIFLSIALCIYR
jgi:hypothetical protein